MNNHSVYPLFPYPLMRASVAVSRSTVDFVSNQQFLRSPNNDGWLSNNKHILDEKELFGIKESIQQTLDSYVFDVLKINRSVSVNLLNSWVVKHNKNDSCTSHSHFNSLISGILYTNVSDSSGNLVFEKNPLTNLFPSLKFNTVESNMFNSGSFFVTPGVGDMIIFPSILNHSVTANLDNIERTCISFNAFLDGCINSTKNDPVGLSNLTLITNSRSE